MRCFLRSRDSCAASLLRCARSRALSSLPAGPEEPAVEPAVVPAVESSSDEASEALRLRLAGAVAGGDAAGESMWTPAGYGSSEGCVGCVAAAGRMASGDSIDGGSSGSGSSESSGSGWMARQAGAAALLMKVLVAERAAAWQAANQRCPRRLLRGAR
ncbi:hypothetical protein BC831DRAFT_477832 [Entophlyctis helioformis]|nr:hypothetical protein BC831DRAFT_477832 [Entophlyctis helioformis]